MDGINFRRWKYIAAGAPNNSSIFPWSGQVRVYYWDTDKWIQKGLDINGEYYTERFGWSVSLSNDGNSLVASANLFGDAGEYKGRVQKFEWDGFKWISKGNSIAGIYELDFFGSTIAIS